jgi:indole-3-glycerol phosphate synthase
MTDKLTEICQRKREHIAQQKTRISEADLQDKAAAAGATRGFVRALERKVHTGHVGLIAEVKKGIPKQRLDPR